VGPGQETIYEIAHADRKSAAIELRERERRHIGWQREPGGDLALYVSMLNRDRKLEQILQKGTELGVAEFRFLFAERSVKSQASPEKLARWQQIVTEAVEQSERVRMPNLVAPPVAITDVQERGGYALVAREHPRAGGLPKLETGDRLAILVGPEGGLSAAEMAHLDGLGWHWASLGPRVLRSETAAIAALARLTA
jgi:16S rRNA (uracil1498-N3)-methyltransferase